MSNPEPRDVWLSAAVRHAPAHRIPLHAVPGPGGTRVVWPIACPPHLASGGVAVTRKQAAALPALPCLRCFPPAVQP